MTSTTVPLKQDAKTVALIGLAHGTSHFFHMMLAPLFPMFMEGKFVVEGGREKLFSSPLETDPPNLPSEEELEERTGDISGESNR